MEGVEVIAAIIVGLDKWNLYTLPCIKSIQATNPEIKIVCVDNGSEPPYPLMKGVTNIRLERAGSSYAGGINAGMKAVEADWYIVINNDVVFKEPITKKIEKLNPDTLYGGVMFTPSKVFPKGDWINGWFMVISSKLKDAVGYFDEHFKPLWFEDVDYSWRASDAGFGMKQLDYMGVVHLDRDADRKLQRHNAKKVREITYTYLLEKHGLL